jgi:hypothetical protein
MAKALIGGIIVVIVIIAVVGVFLLNFGAGSKQSATVITTSQAQATTQAQTTTQISILPSTDNAFLTTQQLSGVFGGNWSYSTLYYGKLNGTPETQQLISEGRFFNFTTVQYQIGSNSHVKAQFGLGIYNFENLTAAKNFINYTIINIGPLYNGTVKNGTVGNIRYLYVAQIGGIHSRYGDSVLIYNQINKTVIFEDYFGVNVTTDPFYSGNNVTLDQLNISSDAEIASLEYQKAGELPANYTVI